MKVFAIFMTLALVGVNGQLSNLFNFFSGSGTGSGSSSSSSGNNNLLNTISGLFGSLGDLLNNNKNKTVDPSVLLNNIGDLFNVGSAPNGSNPINNFIGDLSKMENEVNKVIDQLLKSNVTGLNQAGDVKRALDIYKKVVANYPELKKRLTGVNNLRNASIIISDFVRQYVDPSVDLRAIILNYYKFVAPNVYESIKYSQNFQSLIENLIMTFSSGNVNPSDPNFYSNLFYKILNSGVLDFQSLMNPPTNSPTDLPDISLPANFDFGMLLNNDQLIPFQNDMVLVKHVGSFLPELVEKLLSAQNNNDIVVIIENTIKAHMTPDILNRIKSHIQEIDPILYNQIKNINDTDILYPQIMLYIESFVVNQMNQFASLIGIDIRDFFNLQGMKNNNTFAPTTPSGQNVLEISYSNLLIALYSDNRMFPNRTSAEKLAAFEKYFKMFFSNSEVLNALKLSLIPISPMAYQAVMNANDVDTFYNNFKPYLPLIGNQLQRIAQLVPGFNIPNDFFAFLGGPILPPPPPTSSTSRQTTGGSTLPPLSTTTIRPSTSGSTLPPLSTTTRNVATSLPVTLPPVYINSIMGTLSELILTYPMATTNEMKIKVIENAFVKNMNDPIVMGLIKDRLRLINNETYLLVANTKNISELYSYIKPYLQPLFLNDIQTVANSYNLPINSFLPAIISAFNLLAPSTTTRPTTQPPSTTPTTTTRPTTQPPSTTPTTTTRPTTQPPSTTTRPTTQPPSTTPTTTTRPTTQPPSTTTRPPSTTTRPPSTTPTTTTRPTTQPPSTTTRPPSTTTATTRPPSTTTATTTRPTTNLLSNILNLIDKLSTTTRTTISRGTLKPFLG